MAMDLAAATVDAVARAATAAVTSAGGAAGGMVVDLVRGRLNGVDQGAEAVAAVERTPEDPDARSQLREKLAAVLSEDPAFAAYLASVLAPPPPASPPSLVGSINIDRNGRARGTFVLGDQAVTKIRQGSPGALVGLLLIAALLVTAIYGLGRLVTDDDGQSPGGSRGGGRQVKVLDDPAVVSSVAPDLHSMPTGWTTRSTDSLESGADACPDGTDCKGVLHTAQASFRNPFDQSASFAVVACASAADAQRVYEDIAGTSLRSGRPLAMPALGDQSSAAEMSKGQGLALARVGTVVVYVSEKGSNDDYEVETLQALAQMVAQRAQEAQNGQTPSSRANLRS
ncbi:hypothetical protein [Streptomyces sp. NBC_01264]|uniref:hypothetical protein n=1 Tax=Streptomyces sp. NBC_01264 TaxID=2903804 RepID=UPI00224DFBB2|nr:hypothetical protein [Streptomyces sp. NBC_01264]MCX4777903.1 hypothetical protein [Streptomyces sp. NBC_01264]